MLRLMLLLRITFYLLAIHSRYTINRVFLGATEARKRLKLDSRWPRVLTIADKLGFEHPDLTRIKASLMTGLTTAKSPGFRAKVAVTAIKIGKGGYRDASNFDGS